VGWISLLAQELMRDTRVTTDEAIQAAVLALIFVGYAVGWRNELAGALVALFGTIVFFTVCTVTYGQLPNLAVAWFALPSMLYVFGKVYAKEVRQVGPLIANMRNIHEVT
jgi:hypothetical protein